MPAQVGGAGGAGATGGSPTTGGNGGSGNDSACGAGCDVDCEPSLATPSNGECADNLGYECNPVTNEGCNTPAGQVCDYGPGGFQCYSGENTAEVCRECQLSGPGCAAGFTCRALEDADVFGVCAKFCCDSGDCGPGGVCALGALGVGYCQASGTGPGSGGGGSGNMGGMPNGGMGGVGNMGGMGGGMAGMGGGMAGMGGVGGT